MKITQNKILKLQVIKTFWMFALFSSDSGFRIPIFVRSSMGGSIVVVLFEAEFRTFVITPYSISITFSL